jgi:hypothetical protein
MSLHPEILTARQQRVLNQLAPALSAAGFYLAGGTCLAIRLGHRRSLDLDWFTSSPFESPLRFARRLQQSGVPFTTDRIDAGSLLGRVSNVRVSLLEYPYPILKPATFWPAAKCRLAAIPDLATMKLSAIAQRGSKKDFVDIYALTLRRLPLRKMLGWYQQKYSVSDTAHLRYSLLYFGDAETERMPQMLAKADWRTVKRSIQAWVHAGGWQRRFRRS